MLRLLFSVVLLLTASAAPVRAYAHGTPIRIDVVEGALSVSGGIIDTDGFARQVFADPNPDTAFVPWPGETLLTDFPGVNVNGMEPDSGLYLAPLARTVLGSDSGQERLLWYWNPATEMVEVAPNDESLQVLSTELFGEFTLRQTDAVSPAPLKIAEPQASDLGEHRHVLYYLLDDNPSATSGAYGFFARVTSPAYESSDPFLIALNHGLDANAFEVGALAINAAAAGPSDLAGDYSGNGLVEQSDLDLVLSNWGVAATPPPDGWMSDPPSGNIDQDELDRVLAGWGLSATPPVGASVTAPAIPEPASGLLLGIGLGLSGVCQVFACYGPRVYSRKG